MSPFSLSTYTLSFIKFKISTNMKRKKIKKNNPLPMMMISRKYTSSRIGGTTQFKFGRHKTQDRRRKRI